MSGVHSQTSTMTTAMKAVPLWASISGADSPRNWKSGSVTPTPESRISRHITPTTTGAMVIGRMRPTRMSPLPRSSRETSTARPSPSSVSMVTVQITNFAVVTIASWKNVSWIAFL